MCQEPVAEEEQEMETWRGWGNWGLTLEGQESQEA